MNHIVIWVNCNDDVAVQMWEVLKVCLGCGFPLIVQRHMEVNKARDLKFFP